MYKKYKKVECNKTKHKAYKRKPESLTELIYYNLILMWRKKTGKINLCIWDLSSKEIEKFKKEVKDIFASRGKLVKMIENPFEENEDKILRRLGVID